MTKVRVNLWRLFLSLAFVLPSAGLFFAAQPAAADGINISNMGNTYFQAEGISPDGGTVCAVWSQFDVAPKGAYVRVFRTASHSWAPPLSSAPVSLSTDNPANASSTHCAIDAHGNIHAVWQQCSGNCQIAYRFLPAGADPANPNAWSPVAAIDFNYDGPDIDALYADPNGKVWLVYRNFNGGNGVLLVVRSWAPPADNNPAHGWSGPQNVDTGSASSEKARIGVDNQGYVQLAWRQGNDGVGYTYRDKTTGQFQQPIVLNGSGGAGMVGLAVNRTSGDVYITYPQGLTNVFFVKKTGPVGMSLSGAQLVTSTDKTLRTQIAWSQNGRLLLTYDAGGTIAARTSENGGASWDGQLTIAGSGQDPWIVADGTGAGYIVYNNGGVVNFATIPPNTPPTVSGFQAVPNTMTSVTVHWTVSAPATNRIFYSTSPAVDQNSPNTVGDPTVTTTPAITVRNLAPGTTYYYIVRSTSTSGPAVSTVQSFTTPSIEIVGVHDGAGNTVSGNGRFAGRVLVPAGAHSAYWTWTVNGQQSSPFAVTGGAVSKFGNSTPVNAADSTYTVTVHFDNGASLSAPLHIEPTLTQTTFTDVSPGGSANSDAIYNLVALGMINGYEDSYCVQHGQQPPCFGPLDPVQRGATAALVARALGWQSELGIKSFPDQGYTDPETWNDVKVLAEYNVTFGFPNGTYGPTVSVTWGQMISLISRSMVAKGYWVNQPDNGCLPGTGTSGQDRQDLVNFCTYVPSVSSFFNPADYRTPAQRRFVARLLWEAVKTLQVNP